MAHERILVGQFLGKRGKNPDTSEDRLAPGGQLERAKSLLEQDLPNKDLRLGFPGKLPTMPAPPIGRPGAVPFEPAPKLPLAHPAGPQPSLPVTLSRPPADPIAVADPARTVPAAEQPHPASPLTRTAPEEPHPTSPLTRIAAEQPHPEMPKAHVAVEQPHPTVPKTAAAGEQPHPTIPKTLAAAEQPHPETPKTHAAAEEPHQVTPKTVPAAEEPHPTLPHSKPPVGTGKTPAQPAPALGKPSVIPPPADRPPFRPAQPAAEQHPKGFPAGPGPVRIPSFAPDTRTIDPTRAQFTDDPAYTGDQRASIGVKLDRADASLKELVRQIDSEGRYAIAVGAPFATQGDHAWDPLLYAKHVARLGHHLGVAGLALHAGTQAALFLLNRRGKIWNPLLTIPPPILQNFLPPALDVDELRTLVTGKGAPVRDIHRELAEGKYNEIRGVSGPPFVEKVVGAGSAGAQNLFQGIPIIGGGRIIGAQSQDTSLVDDPNAGVPKPLVVAALQLRNKYGPGEDFGGDGSNRSGPLYQEHAVAPVDQLIDDVLDGKDDSKHIVRGEDLARYKRSRAGGDDHSETTVNKFLNIASSKIGFGFTQLATGEQRPIPGDAKDHGIAIAKLPLLASSFPDGIIPVKFKGENKFGFSTFDEGEQPAIKDDDAYVPLSFTDLRPVGKTYRTIYFRPFITNLSEEFSPEWNKQNYFGRADTVATYQSTGRTIQLGFKIVAFGPEDVSMIYKKLNWLASMVYPEYDSDLAYKSGPVVRMRVGDVINALGPEGGRGLPGIIENMSFDYNEAIWELKDKLKVPRNVNVSLSFLVLHDMPVGRGTEGKFGGLGEIRSGRFIPPAADRPAAAGDDTTKTPVVKSGFGSFRANGNDPNEANAYDTLSSADKTGG